MEEEKDNDDETSEFIPIDSVDLTGEEDEDEVEEQPSSPFSSPQRQKQAKKTSITPDLSKHRSYQLFACSLELRSVINSIDSCILSFTEKKATPKLEPEVAVS